MTDGIPASTLRSVLEFTEVLRSCADSVAFSSALTSGIANVVKSDYASLSQIDVASQEIVEARYPVQPLTTHEQAIVQEFLPAHPIVRHYLTTADRAARTLSDFWTQRELRRSPLYTEYYEPRRIRYQLAVRLPGRPGTRRALVVSRSGTDYTPRERELLQVVASQAADLEELITTRPLIREVLADMHCHDGPGTALPVASRQQALMVRICEFIEHNLDDPALSPGMIAAAHHISLRTLHKLYETEEDTIAASIRRRRLERCRQDLLDPALRDRPVSAVGARWGFPDSAVFSRAFRSAYGRPPSQYRALRANSNYFELANSPMGVRGL